MKIVKLNLQINTNSNCFIPKKKIFLNWIESVLSKKYEITIRIVDKIEINRLNLIYRKKNKPTNILSFKYHNIYINNLLFLGDIIICAKILEQEAYMQNKLLKAHWAHIVIHGTLHLIGYHHYDLHHKNIMQALEIKIMKKLGYKNPYNIK